MQVFDSQGTEIKLNDWMTSSRNKSRTAMVQIAEVYSDGAVRIHWPDNSTRDYILDTIAMKKTMWIKCESPKK